MFFVVLPIACRTRAVHSFNPNWSLPPSHMILKNDNNNTLLAKDNVKEQCRYKKNIKNIKKYKKNKNTI
jgi:hypothetical protein